MKKDMARNVIIEKFRAWMQEQAITNPSGQDGLAFFAYLQDECPDLLAFRYSGDKWQCVHGWLLNADLESS